MALSKTVTDERGVVANYHRIESISFDYNSMSASIKLVSYVSSDVRKADPTATVASRDFGNFWAPTTPPTDDREWAYAVIKTVDGWQDATAA